MDLLKKKLKEKNKKAFFKKKWTRKEILDIPRKKSFLVSVLFLFFYSFLFVYHYKKSTELFYICWSQQWQNNSTRVVSGQKQRQLYSL